MNKLLGIHRNNPLFKEYLFFRVGHTFAYLVSWSYFAVLLLRTVDNPIDAVPVVIQHLFGLYTGIMLGFMISGQLVNYLGYLNLHRLANLIQALVTLLALFTLPHIEHSFFEISVMVGIGRGIFWNLVHMFNTNEIHGQIRSSLISSVYGANSLLQVIMPIMIGAVISYISYSPIFIAGFIIYGFMIYYPWKFNKKPRDKMNFSQLKEISQKKGFKRWGTFMYLEGATVTMREIVLSVIPFIFIGDEFGVGVLGSAVGLVGVSLVFLHRNDKFAQKRKAGILGSAIVAISTSGLLFIWNLPALVIRSLITKVGFSLYTPYHEDLDYHLREKMLGDFKNEYGVEVQQFSEFFLYVARVSIIILFLILHYVVGINIQTILMIFLALSIGREPMFVLVGGLLNSKLRISPTKIKAQTTDLASETPTVKLA